MNSAVPSPTLSVVIPAYRAEPYLPQCLDSILAEPADGLEVVVVEDRSPDRTGPLADAYARRLDQRVRVVHLATSVGPGRARNLGLELARGEYVWFVDADDWLPPGSVAAVLARLARTRPDVLVVNHSEVFPDGRVVPGAPAGVLSAGTTGGPLTDQPQLLRLAHSACTKVVRRRFLDEIGLRFSRGWYEDSSYNPPLLLAARRIDVLDRVCYHYRQRPGGTITKSISARHFEVFAQYEQMWAAAQGTGESYERFQPELFQLMINHLLVIAGSGNRVPPRLRRDFFRRLAREYRRRLPADGYQPPAGMTGLKHRLVRWNAYEVYAALRLAWRTAGRLRSRPDRAMSAPVDAPGPASQPVDLAAR